tara:strand:+ start:4739 stop:5371 length:633 start_codon:yes stop_codon:yes gene_type:complete
MLISILIPTISERGEQFQKLQDGLYTQIKANKLEKKVEIISISDNRTIPLSQKRNMLQKLARGKYFTHLDDDDNLADDYCKTMVDFIEHNVFKQYNKLPDIIGYDQICYVEKDTFVVKPNLNFDFNLSDPPYGMPSKKEYKEFMRYPWQFLLWNTKRFSEVYRTDSDTNAREDQNWLKKVQLEYPKSMAYNPDYIGHIYHFEDPSLSSCQ